MNQRPFQHTHEERTRSWAEEGQFAQSSRGQGLPAYPDSGGLQDSTHLTHRQVAYQDWYNESGGTHMQASYENAQQTQWPSYSLPGPGGYYDQPTQVPYHPPQHTSQHLPQEHALPLDSWSNRVITCDDLASYPPSQHPHQNQTQREPHTMCHSLPEPTPVHSVPPVVRGRHRGPVVNVSRGPSQTLGPYTSTALQSPSDVSPVNVSAAELIASRAHTPYGEHSQHGIVQASSTLELQTRSAEASQFVVPSSRVPRADVSPHPPMINRQLLAHRASHSPEIPTETKPKRRRANAAQLSVLNETYARTLFPTTEERADIARRINMTPRQVQIWFQNRRQASRQTQVPDSPASFGSQDAGISQHGFSVPSSGTSEYHEGSSSYTSSGADRGPPYDAESDGV